MSDMQWGSLLIRGTDRFRQREQQEQRARGRSIFTVFKKKQEGPLFLSLRGLLGTWWAHGPQTTVAGVKRRGSNEKMQLLGVLRRVS